MKNVQMDLDRMDKAMLAEIAARSRQLGVTTGIQCRANERREKTRQRRWRARDIVDARRTSKIPR